jgi:hypothetical protein
VVHRHALRAYFSADDVALFEQVRGLAPQGAGPWRWLSLHLYVGSMFHAFGADPGPYHVVNWLVHGLDTGLVFAVARALGGGPLAATLAAGLFGASRLYLPALFQVATFGELAALAGACTALLLARREHLSARIGAALVFAAALLAKEVVALLPAVLLVTTGKPEPLAARARDEPRPCSPSGWHISRISPSLRARQAQSQARPMRRGLASTCSTI